MFSSTSVAGMLAASATFALFLPGYSHPSLPSEKVSATGLRLYYEAGIWGWGGVVINRKEFGKTSP